MYRNRSATVTADVPAAVVTRTSTVPTRPPGSGTTSVVGVDRCTQVPAVPNLTARTPDRFVPVIVTSTPPQDASCVTESRVIVGRDGPVASADCPATIEVSTIVAAAVASVLRPNSIANLPGSRSGAAPVPESRQVDVHPFAVRAAAGARHRSDG